MSAAPALAVQQAGGVVALPFDSSHAERRADQWAVADGAIAFSFAPDRWGYLVEAGNSTNFSQPVIRYSVEVTAPSQINFQLNFTSADLAAARLDLFCFFLRDDNTIIDRSKHHCTQLSQDFSPTLPAGTARLCFALRLAGQGKFAGLALAVQQQKISPKTAPAPATPNKSTTKDKASKAKPSNQNERVSFAQQAADAIAVRNFGAAMQLLHQAPQMGDSEHRQYIRAAAAAHQFEQVLASFAALSANAQHDTGNRIYMLRALANLGQFNSVEVLLRESCIRPEFSAAHLHFLLMAYPFASSLNPGLAQQLTAKIIQLLPYYQDKLFNYLLRLAHDAITANDAPTYFKLAELLHSKANQPEQHAKLAILRGQHAYVLQDYALQLAQLNQALAQYQVAPLVCANTAEPFNFSGITVPACTPRSVTGPKVSVLMTSYNCAATIGYAVQSICQQTYANLEIIVIDDASNDRKTKPLLRKLAKQDARIKLILLPENGGTYIAKNHGLAVATGEYVTCQDADDWAHPQKIEKNVEQLEDNPSLMASAVSHVRYDPARGFRGLGGYIRFDASSMMYRRAPVMEKIGFYDSVRVGADSEYQFRLERVFGRDALKVRPELLSLVLWSENSLSGGGQFAIDDDTGVFTPFRNAYRRGFCAWQEQTENLLVPQKLAHRHFEIDTSSKI